MISGGDYVLGPVVPVVDLNVGAADPEVASTPGSTSFRADVGDEGTSFRVRPRAALSPHDGPAWCGDRGGGVSAGAVAGVLMGKLASGPGAGKQSPMAVGDL
jgi:hypothetical protein